MTWVKGQSGNPLGQMAGMKLMAEAIRIAALDTDKTTKKTKLRVIAERAVAAAMTGESWAVQFVADRLDGKARQETEVNVSDKREAVDWSRQELLTIVANAAIGSSDVAPEGRRLKKPD